MKVTSELNEEEGGLSLPLVLGTPGLGKTSTTRIALRIPGMHANQGRCLIHIWASAKKMAPERDNYGKN